MPNIAIVWDFDGTLTPQDSTSLVVEKLDGRKAENFWNYVKTLRGDTDKPEWEHVLASDAPVWMYALSRIAFIKEIPLNEEYFKTLVSKVKLYPQARKCLAEIKLLSEEEEFKKANVEVFHFIVSAGLRDFVRLILTKDLVRWVWGCRYEIMVDKEDSDSVPESVPVYCMDETAKTRALFEIS